MDYHEFANIFPLIEGDDFENLKEDISVKGQSEPIVLFEGKVLDGRNRLRACQALGIVPIFREYTGDDALGYVISNNLKRRHLTESQRACIALDVLPLLEAQARKRQACGQGGVLLSQLVGKANEGRAAEGAAKTFGTNRQYISDAKRIKAERPELFNAILRGDKTISEVKTELKKEVRQKAIAKQRQAIADGSVELPEGLYEVIVIDPPWPYEREYEPDNSRVASPYPEMSIDELRALTLPASDDCVLWLWTTHKFIWEAKELLDKWGFSYKLTLVWDKESIGMGKWLRMQCEFCLLGIKGKPVWDNTTERDILREQKTNHSAKPTSFYALVDKLCVGRKLDFFARERRDGWDAFGDEV